MQKAFSPHAVGETINKVSDKYRCPLYLYWPKTASHKDTKDASRKPKKSPYPVNTQVNMMLPKKKQNRLQLFFKAKEAPAYMPMEEYLMDVLDIPTRSDTYKMLLRTITGKESKHNWSWH